MEERRFRVKRYAVWILLLARRLWRQPAYVCLLVLLPLLGYAAGMMEGGERGGASVAVRVEKGAWSDRIVTLLSEQEAGSVLRFVFCDSKDEVRRRVAIDEADCGFVIGADLAERVLGGDWRGTVTVYETDASSVTGMAKERIAGIIFRLYSEERYREYVGEISESAVDFAMEAYEDHLLDGSTFGFRYLYSDSKGQSDSDTDVGNDNIVNDAVFPIKGVFAVLIFVGGMCGMLEYEKDKKEKRFLRFAPAPLTYVVDVWMATVFLSAAALLCLWIFEGIRSCDDLNAGWGTVLKSVGGVWNLAEWGGEIARMLLYQCMIIIYCVILRILLRRQETIAAAIPILTLCSLACAPVFIRLGAYLPVFAVLEKLFPVSYYLLL